MAARRYENSRYPSTYENANARQPSSYGNANAGRTSPYQNAGQMERSAYENTDTRYPSQYENGLQPQSYAEEDTAYQNMSPSPYNGGSTRQPHDPTRLHPSHAAYNGRHSPARVEDVELGAINPAYSEHTGERPRSDSIASSASYQSDNLDIDEILERERIASSLQDPESVLSMLPSRQMGHTISRATTSNKWVNKSRRNSARRGTIHRQLSRSMSVRKGYEDSDTDRVVEQILTGDGIENEAQATLRRRATIRQMSSSMSTKRRIRAQVNRSQSKVQKDKSVGLCTAWWYQLAYKWESFKESIANWTYTLELWRNSIKTIEGNFGSGVTSYFVLLKWLLLLNIPVFLLSFIFITLPQILYDSSASYKKAFRPGDFLTGGGWFEDTELYYGYYTNKTLPFGQNDQHYYNMPFAYLLTNGAYFLLILVVLASGTSNSYKDYFITGDKKYNYYVAKVFCGWDYGVTAPNTATLKHRSLYLELAENLVSSSHVEHLSAHHAEKKKSFCEVLGWLFLRITSNAFVLAVICAASFLVFYLYEDVDIDTGLETLDEIAVPLLITGYNLLLPYMFSAIGRLEQYDNPRYRLYMSLFRTFLMKAAMLLVLLSFWLKPCESDDCPECWETYVGMEIYKLVLLDFIVQSAATFFLEFIRSIIFRCGKCSQVSDEQPSIPRSNTGIGRDRCCHGFTQPEFDIARNTMDLIQAQTYTWIGMYFSPLLMVFCIVKLFLLFYVKKISVLANCKPSLQPWRAGLAKTTFLVILSTMFLICVGAIGYSLSQLDPSDSCGPFRGLDNAFDVIEDQITQGENSQRVWVILLELATSPGVVSVIIIVLCLLVYYNRVVTQGRQQTVKQLKQQITLEGKDKRFLLKMLQDAVKHRKLGGGGGDDDHAASPGGRRRRRRKDNGAVPNASPSPSPKKAGKGGKGKGKGNKSPVRAPPHITAQVH